MTYYVGMASLPKLQWTDATKDLATALGVGDFSAHVFETVAERVIGAGGGIRAVLEAFQSEIQDMTFEEWTAAVFALGHLDGSR